MVVKNMRHNRPNKRTDNIKKWRDDFRQLQRFSSFNYYPKGESGFVKKEKENSKTN